MDSYSCAGWRPHHRAASTHDEKQTLSFSSQSGVAGAMAVPEKRRGILLSICAITAINCCAAPIAACKRSKRSFAESGSSCENWLRI